MRWFRFYADAMRDPKVARLNDSEFRLWLECLCVACENDGKIPAADDLKHLLKRRLDHLSRGLKGLIRAGLMDPLEDGYKPHGWDKRQYKSDTSTERSRKHRKKCNVAATPPDTDTEQSIPLAKANGGDGDSDKLFWANAKDYLRPYINSDPGALVNKWLREHKRELTGQAIAAAQMERAADPVAYIQGFFRKRENEEWSGGGVGPNGEIGI